MCELTETGDEYTRVSQKVMGLFKKSTFIVNIQKQTNITLLFNVIPLDFNAPVPAYHKYFNSVRKKKRFFWGGG
jgi:hypothetical protein